MRRLALKMALSQKFLDRELTVLDAFNLAQIKTRDFAAFMKRFELGKTLAKAILPALSGGADSGDFDVATRGMVAAIRASNLRERDTPSS